jgi:hypothetical protein
MGYEQDRKKRKVEFDICFMLRIGYRCMKIYSEGIVGFVQSERVRINANNSIDNLPSLSGPPD